MKFVNILFLFHIITLYLSTEFICVLELFI